MNNVKCCDCFVGVCFSVSVSVEVKTVKQGSLSAVLDSGVRLSYSFYGPTGQRTGVRL